MANTIKQPKNGNGGVFGVWWGQVAPNQTENEIATEGHGFRVRVRILGSTLPDGKGTHPLGAEIRNEDLPLIQVKMPTTHGNGSRLSCGLIGGEMVTGYFLDSEGNLPIIDGVLARTVNDNQITAQEAQAAGTTYGLRLDPYSQKGSKVPPSKRQSGTPPSPSAALEGVSVPDSGLPIGKGMQGIPTEPVEPQRQVGDVYTDASGNRFEVVRQNNIEGEFNPDGTNRTFNVVRQLN